jgi:uncharacterized protein (DUF924 family)
VAQTVQGSADPSEVLRFWFADGNAARWFVRDDEFDAAIRQQFASVVDATGDGHLQDWTRTPEGWLALLIVLDQFPRNLYRGDARAFACDDRALSMALQGLERGDDLLLPVLHRAFAYLPLEHAEDLVLQERSVALFSALCAAVELEHRAQAGQFLDYAQRHREVIARFGRFPHRNATLGRASTPAELAYLAEPGAGF